MGFRGSGFGVQGLGDKGLIYPRNIRHPRWARPLKEIMGYCMAKSPDAKQHAELLGPALQEKL